MKRKIINIDEEKCTGCGQCIPNCPEGAIQIIDGKARLVNDRFCDGLGACLGHCPENAITVEEREAEPYDERKVMEQIVKQGANVIKAHLEHLREHNQTDDLRVAAAVLAQKGIANPLAAGPAGPRAHEVPHHGCPGAQSRRFAAAAKEAQSEANLPSQLTHWPIQMHLMSPLAPQYQGADVVLAADCVAYALGNFHGQHLAGKALAIACPKLDDGQEVYVSKIRALIDDARINTLTVMIMEVPCCMGLLRLAEQAAAQAKRKVPVKSVVVSLDGAILEEQWL